MVAPVLNSYSLWEGQTAEGSPYTQNVKMAFAPRYLAFFCGVMSLMSLLVLGGYYVCSGFNLSKETIDITLSIAKWSAIGSAGATALGIIRDIYAAVRAYLTTHSSKIGCKIAREELGLTLISIPLGFILFHKDVVVKMALANYGP